MHNGIVLIEPSLGEAGVRGDDAVLQLVDLVSNVAAEAPELSLRVRGRKGTGSRQSETTEDDSAG